MSESDDDIEYYGDTQIASKDAEVPRWLIWIFAAVFVWGIVWLYLFWGGATGWIDRGYWYELEQAANTTFPYRDADYTEKTAPPPLSKGG